MNISQYLDRLQSNGQYCFTSQMILEQLQISPNALRVAIKRLREKNRIVTAAKQFYLILPPEYARQGSLPAAEFIPHLMKHWNIEYYAGLLTAAEYHGAAHQRPQRFQVIIERYKPNIQCGSVGIQFIVNKKIQQIPTTTINTPRSILKVSTPESTAIDLVTYQQAAGGLSHIATVLQELSENINKEKLFHTACSIASTSTLQRLGYLFEILKQDQLADAVCQALMTRKPQYIPLVNQNTIKNAIRNAVWKLQINYKVEIDLSHLPIRYRK